MITLIEALGFRCLRDVRVPLAPFNVLVGPNGSGKTTLLDVVAFLADVLEVQLHNAVGERTPLDARDLVWGRDGSAFSLAIEMRIPEALAGLFAERWEIARWEMMVEIEPALAITTEHFFLVPEREPAPPSLLDWFPAPPGPPRTHFEKAPKGSRTVVSRKGGDTHFYPEHRSKERKGWMTAMRFDARRSGLAEVPADEIQFPVATWFKNVIGRLHDFMLDSRALKDPSPPKNRALDNVLSRDGSNLPWAIATLEEGDEPRRRLAEWTAHVRTALPTVREIATVLQEHDRSRYIEITYDNGLRVPSWLLSDGTLRLLALTLPAYLAPYEALYLIEEPENGIHPQAVETVFQSLSSLYETQALIATHSTVVLNLAEPKDVLCFALDADGATQIVRGDRHPALREWKKSVGLGVLFGSGVLG